MFSAGMLACSEIVYVHLDWFVYKILIFLRMLRMARNVCMHVPLFEYNNLKSLVIHSGIPKLYCCKS